jgi:hypothetical protein
MTAVRLPAQSQPVLRATVWLREHLARPDYESIDDDFAEYFRCRVVRGLSGSPEHTNTTYVEFDPKTVTLFLLKWS